MNVIQQELKFDEKEKEIFVIEKTSEGIKSFIELLEQIQNESLKNPS